MPITMLLAPKGVMRVSFDALTCMGNEKLERIKSKPKSASICGIASGFESNNVCFHVSRRCHLVFW